MSVDLSLDFGVKAIEKATKDLGTAKMVHSWSLVQSLARGTAASNCDLVWSDTRTVVATTDTLDLLGVLTSQLDASSVSFVGGVVLIAIYNKATTTGYTLSVGAGSNPFAGWSGAGANTRVVHPGGIEVWYSPIDDVLPIAGTGDILSLNSGANTITYDIIIAGRSA